MQKIHALLFSTILLAAAACKCPRHTADKLPPDQLLFGSGGGITGQVRTTVLLCNGQLFQKDPGGAAFYELPKIKRKAAKSFYKKADALRLGEAKFDHPGNLYFFVERQGGAQAGRASWGDDRFPVDAQVKELSDALNGLLKTTVKD